MKFAAQQRHVTTSCTVGGGLTCTLLSVLVSVRDDPPVREGARHRDVRRGQVEANPVSVDAAWADTGDPGQTGAAGVRQNFMKKNSRGQGAKDEFTWIRPRLAHPRGAPLCGPILTDLPTALRDNFHVCRCQSRRFRDRTAAGPRGARGAVSPPRLGSRAADRRTFNGRRSQGLTPLISILRGAHAENSHDFPGQGGQYFACWTEMLSFLRQHCSTLGTKS